MPPSEFKPNTSKNTAKQPVPPFTISLKSKPITKDPFKADKKAFDMINSKHINVKRLYHKLRQADPPSIVRNNPKGKQFTKFKLPKPCTGEAIPLHERLGRA